MPDSLNRPVRFAEGNGTGATDGDGLGFAVEHGLQPSARNRERTEPTHGQRGDRFLVAGAGGVLGNRIARAIAEMFGPGRLVVGDYRVRRAHAVATAIDPKADYAVVDVTDWHSVKRALEDVACVIVAAPQSEPLVERACAAENTPCLDVVPDRSLVNATLSIESPRTTIVPMAGFFPGLSGIFASDAATEVYNSLSDDATLEIDVGLAQSSQATAGATGIADMLELVGESVAFRAGEDERTVPGFSESRWFKYPEPIGSQRHRLANFPEREYLGTHGPTLNVNYWTSWDDPARNRLIAALARTRVLQAFASPRLRIHLARPLARLGADEGPEYAGIGVRVRGEHDGETAMANRAVVFTADYEATASAAVVMATLLLERDPPPGVHFPFELWSFEDLRPGLESVIVAECGT
ncbi:hypothetical protein ACLI4Y_14850 [Natrialbaceae archaeon A-CW3]